MPFRVLLFLAWFLTIAFTGLGQKDYKLKNVIIEGNSTIKDADIKANMNSKEKIFIDKIQFWKKSPRFSTFTLEEDLIRLNHLYQRNGFLTPQIHYELAKKDSSKSVKLTLKIIEGQSVKINNIKVNSEGEMIDIKPLDESKKETQLMIGDRFQDEKIKNYETFLLKLYADAGYPFAKVTHEILLTDDHLTADLLFKVIPGVKCSFGPTWLKTDSIVPESFIRNKLEYKEGEAYSKKYLEDSQKELYDTELFQFVVLRTLLDSLKDDRVPILLQLKSKPRWSIETGVGYGNEDRFRIMTEITKRQFLGGARRLVFSGISSYTLPVALQFSLVQPDFLTNKLDLILNPFFIWNNEPSYEVKRLGASIALKRNFTRSTSGYLMYQFEKDWFALKSEDPLSPSEQDSLPYNKSGFSLGMTHETTDDIFNPSRGIRFNSFITLMGIGFQSQYHYLKAQADFRKYFKFQKRSVLAFKLRGGFMQPIMGDTETPIEDRFMLGGPISLRGWGNNQISPVNQENQLVGGNSMLESSLELRFPLYDIVSGAVFIDSGNVWEKPFGFDLGNLRTDMGLGLRVETPIGPIRIDFATPMFESKLHLMYFFSIGHAF
jgi:outer membrane protein insertion porin family